MVVEVKAVLVAAAVAFTCVVPSMVKEGANLSVNIFGYVRCSYAFTNRNSLLLFQLQL